MSDTLTPTRPTTLLPLLAIGVTVVMWASAFVAIRFVGREFSAGSLSLGRLVTASAVLGLLLLLRRPAPGGAGSGWPTGRGWWAVVVCGVTWFGVYNVALNEAERRIDAGTASMLVNIGPILIAVLAGWLLREGFPRGLLIGGGIAFAGVVVIGLGSSSGGVADTWGVVLCVVAAICYAIGVVSQKPLLSRVSPLRVTWLACTVGVVVCLPFAPTLVTELGDASSAGIWWLVYLGIGPTALAFTTWAFALARTSAGKQGATTYLVPPMVIAMAWVLLGETPAGIAVIGGVICLTGVYLTRRRHRGTPELDDRSPGDAPKIST
ncbi:drug/metabolite transporter (DMT)-like permease [Stackebrandtia endophytica]|uniref:Drug/metabolite transporter (DMT)-like permease n=1 Tax=Stackebrandtia endophytica TaxID=1496996 RepID=A0A543AYZ5_9ACTN|nr:DMT family transporter [Stackebrandtia endophytica]TQL77797.1 drug/metabolite transporter (DMT)-like permease [Stackebrandtia endophytica]